MFDRKRSKVPVASAEVFVGRRLETQAVLRAFGPWPEHAGVVVHGMGRLGESSLAARVRSRMPRHHRMAVVFGEQPGEYAVLAVFNAVVEALPPEQRTPLRQAWATEIGRDPRQLHDALQAMLTGPAASAAPLLLVIDDVQRILEQPAPKQQRTPVQAGLRDTLSDVIRAFDGVRSQTDSRLLLTSRYLFTLPAADGSDLALRLFDVQLPPVNERQRSKLLQAEARVAPAPARALTQEQGQRMEELLDRASAIINQMRGVRHRHRPVAGSLSPCDAGCAVQ